MEKVKAAGPVEKVKAEPVERGKVVKLSKLLKLPLLKPKPKPKPKQVKQAMKPKPKPMPKQRKQQRILCNKTQHKVKVCSRMSQHSRMSVRVLFRNRSKARHHQTYKEPRIISRGFTN